MSKTSKTIKSANQFSLFDEPAAVQPEPSPGPEPWFDPTQLRVIQYDGVPVVVDLDVARSFRYPQVRSIRKLIGRLIKHRGWGIAIQRVSQYEFGTGGRRDVIENLLTEKQIVLCAMRCELPHIDQVQSLIADVFVEWRRGNLCPTNAETETKLHDSCDRAFDQSPDTMNLLHRVTADGVKDANVKLDRLSEYLREMQRSFDENVREPRNHELSDNIWKQDIVVAELLDCYCPICRHNKIIVVTERGPDNKVKKLRHVDRMYHHAHLLLRTVRGLFNTMPMCQVCNGKWERQYRTEGYEWVLERTRTFHRLLREVWGVMELPGAKGK